MELTTGLYIAYEIVKGVGIIAGADQQLVGLADRFTAIAKLLPKPAIQNTEADNSAGSSVGADAASAVQEIARLGGLLMLLAHSKVTLDLAELRSAVGETEDPMLIGDVAFLFTKPLSLGDLRVVRNFHSLRTAAVAWDAVAKRFHFTGIADPTSRPRAMTEVVLDSTSASHEIELPARKGVLRLSYLSLKRTAVAPIFWSQALPSIRITYSEAGSERTLAEIVAAVARPTSRRRPR